MRVHAAPLFVSARIQEKIRGEKNKEFVRARGSVTARGQTLFRGSMHDANIETVSVGSIYSCIRLSLGNTVSNYRPNAGQAEFRNRCHAMSVVEKQA